MFQKCASMVIFGVFCLLQINCEVITGFECGHDGGCDDDACIQTKNFILKERAKSSWLRRHPSLEKIYLQHKCNVSAEIGVAYGGLINHMLTYIPTISEYHAIDPFFGGYMKSDQMSSVLEKQNNNSWARATINNFKDQQCRFKLHHGLSTEMAPHFPSELF